MRTLTFRQDNLIDTTTTEDKPVINVVRVVININDTEWTNRLLKTSLELTAVCYNNNKEEIFRRVIPLTLSIYRSLNHKQPVIEIQKTINFINDLQSCDDFKEQSYWITTIVLKNFEFSENETMNVSVIEKTHIQQRVQDWKKRIDDLYMEVCGWVKQTPGFSCKTGHQTRMLEELMNTFEVPEELLQTLDIYKNDKILLALKPKGLWTIAANGRIDIISSKGSFMLVDFAEQFQKPQWNIYTSDKKTKSLFNREIFNNVLLTLAK